MAGRILKAGDSGADVKALQLALNQRAETRFYPPLAVDSGLGPATLHAFQAIGWALGLTEQTIDEPTISVGAQRLILHPDEREPAHLQRAKTRARSLHLRTIAFDGAPTYWGLGKALLQAREHGWGGTLASSDRRKGVAERFGKKSQATLFACMQERVKLGRCPAECGGDCADANAPGASSHEQLSDGSGFLGPVGRPLEWWELGVDVSDSDTALTVLQHLGYEVRRTYPNNPKEHHHLNFTASPGAVLPSDGPAARPAHIPHVEASNAHPRAANGRVVTLTGPDVSQNQADVDWARVKAAGHEFAFAKVTDGLGSPDPAFGKGRWKAMRDAGLVRGAYHFGRPQPGRDPKAEVAEFLAALKAAGGLAEGDLVPVLDIEKFGKAGQLTAKDTLEWVRTWAAELRRRIGRRPLIYTGSFWRDTVGNPHDDLGCKLWLAAYVPEAKVKGLVPVAWADHGPTLWQHTEHGSCPGIQGDCDLNRFRGQRAHFDALRL